MKKIALFISILGIFILASCNDDPYVYESTTNIQTTSNVPKTEVTTTSNESTSETKDDSSYNDNLPWGDFH